jgi:hypothetical protein
MVLKLSDIARGNSKRGKPKRGLIQGQQSLFNWDVAVVHSSRGFAHEAFHVVLFPLDQDTLFVL